MKRPWFAIIWFGVWGMFQAFAVGSILAGRWQMPDVSSQEAYVSLIYPDLVFIPLYLLVAGGGVLYALIYLFALAGFRVTVNLVADAAFLLFTLVALWQVVRGGQAGASHATMRADRGQAPSQRLCGHSSSGLQ